MPIYPDWLDRTLVWEAAKPYLYMRTTPDGRLIVGGEDADLDSPSYRADTLGLKARQAGAEDQPAFAGAEARNGRMSGPAPSAKAIDGLPIIGAVPGHAPLLCGDGVWRQRHDLFHDRGPDDAGLAAGRPPADADLFAFRG